MKKWSLIFFTLLFPIISLTTQAQAATATYTLDPEHSYVLYRINHFGFSAPSGKWYAKGTLTWDEAKPEMSTVKVTIDLATIDTGLKELDDHLKGALFFNVAQFPTATFVSKKVVVTGKNKADVQGTLTLHGTSQPLTLHVQFNKSGVNVITNKMTLGFSATAELKRSDFGITALLPGVGDQVDLLIEAEAYQ